MEMMTRRCEAPFKPYLSLLFLVLIVFIGKWRMLKSFHGRLLLHHLLTNRYTGTLTLSLLGSGLKLLGLSKTKPIPMAIHKYLTVLDIDRKTLTSPR